MSMRGAGQSRKVASATCGHVMWTSDHTSRQGRNAWLCTSQRRPRTSLSQAVSAHAPTNPSTVESVLTIGVASPTSLRPSVLISSVQRGRVSLGRSYGLMLASAT
ncbi:WNT1 inducible signaling pathway protein 1, isoform CRA_b [Rattus norvegicus]|uniref:WNT1 inducible signaling pathway protein 1, isoform CRA_b n=1 Tax=Rattus norvegicus TaxID=10116 RepID=A6HRS4_RAT|nr:WNT1 inducible signaling pathway protein 1, isoform CRA_b [Rattus norvegicus]